MKKLKLLWADKDERNLLINVFFAFLVKGASLFISLFSMPLYIRYFDNNEVLGIWYTILSLLSWIMVCDLGLGNGLRNRLTEALALHDTDAAKRYISSTYVALTVIIMPILVVGSILLQFSNLNAFFNVSSSVVSNRALQRAVTILFCGIGVSFVLKIINVVIYAIQKSSANNFLSLITSALPLCYIAVFSGGSLEQNLFRLSIVFIASINLPLLIATFWIFRCKSLHSCSPSLKSFNTDTAKHMVTFGLWFFLAQIFFMFLMSTNEFFITHLFSAGDVVNYSIYYKLFTAIGSLFMLALTPLWSKVTKDLAEHKYRTIQRTNRVLYLISAMAIAAEFLMVPFLQWVINIWLKNDAIAVDYTTGVIFATYGGLYILNIVLTTVANGMGELRTQVVFYGIGAAIKIPSVFFLRFCFHNWYVVVLYNCIVLLAFCLYQTFWIEKKIHTYIQMEDA